MILCIMGKSCSGKDTISKLLLNLNKDLCFVKPVTTRPKRATETDEYIFVDDDTFKSMIVNNELLEHRSYNVKTIDKDDAIWYYGHIKPQGKYNLIIGDLKLYESLIARFDPSSSLETLVIPIYITIPEDERLFRMLKRSSNDDSINYRELSRRFVADMEDFSDEKLMSLGIHNYGNYTKVFINLDAEETAKKINDYITTTFLEVENMDECKKNLTVSEIVMEFGKSDDLGECNDCPNCVYKQGILTCKLANK